MISDVLLIIILFTGFATLHSAMASLKFKLKVASAAGNRIALYRLFYNITSLITFAAFWELSPKPQIYVYDLDTPFDLIMVALQVVSLAGLIWAGRSMNASGFLGITQLKKWIAGTYDPQELDEKMTLSTGGAYKYSRHPVYLFSILFLGLRPAMSLFYFTAFICMVTYFYIGSVFEEKRMSEIFGEEYLRYKKKVPRIFPIRFNPK